MEITVNKWCALYGRSEIKDIIDLYFLQQTVDIWNAYDKVFIKEEEWSHQCCHICYHLCR
jgi:hypothetical protein